MKSTRRRLRKNKSRRIRHKRSQYGFGAVFSRPPTDTEARSSETERRVAHFYRVAEEARREEERWKAENTLHIDNQTYRKVFPSHNFDDIAEKGKIYYKKISRNEMKEMKVKDVREDVLWLQPTNDTNSSIEEVYSGARYNLYIKVND